MHADVNGTRLWFDVEGAALVPDGAEMRRRPTVVLVHGGPATYDHSYFRPHFARLAGHAQVVYLDLRGHGRSAWGDPAEWSFEVCADDVRAFCDALGIERPVVLGHSMGGFVAILYGARHPTHPAALVLQSTFARFDLDRLTESFRDAAGDEVAGIARRSYSGGDVGEDEWARVYAAFGPRVLTAEELTRRRKNPALAERGGELLLGFDAREHLRHVACPTLVCAGERDPVAPPSEARAIVDGLPPAIGRLAVVAGAGHFPWLDAPDRYFACIVDFIAAAA